MNLSKSKYCKCVQCKKMFWLKKYKPECAVATDKTTVFENGKKVGELAKGLFGDFEDVPYNENLRLMIERTRELMQNEPNIITEASFTFDNNFCSVDILKNDLDGVEIYEVKSSSEVKDIYIDDVAFQYYVLSCLDLNVKKVCIVYVNTDYIRGKELELDKFFNIEDVTEIAKEKWNEVRINIDLIRKYMKGHGCANEPIRKLGMHCKKPYPCDFWEYCTMHLPKNNVFDIFKMNNDKKFEKYYEGKISFEDLEGEKLSKRFSQQIDFELHDKEPYINEEIIKEFLDDLKYPLYFLDYETINPPIPKFEGLHPYQQIPFQYSLHIIKEEGAPLEHKEYLAKTFDENMVRDFADHLIKDISEEGSIIVYSSFEASRNNKIAEMYPDLKEDMERINNNIKDIMTPFLQRNYYTKEMEGSYSIKKVLPALYPNDSDLDYSKLPGVKNGGEAIDAFLSLEGKTEKEQEKIRKGLLKYCELDSLAMVKIWEKFKEVTR